MRQQKEQANLLAVQEVDRKEKEDLVMRMKTLAEQDPELLESVGFLVSQQFPFAVFFYILISGQKRSTYLAMAGSTCTNCATKGVVCHGITGKSCDRCSRLHATCSNAGK